MKNIIHWCISIFIATLGTLALSLLLFIPILQKYYPDMPFYVNIILSIVIFGLLLMAVQLGQEGLTPPSKIQDKRKE